MMRPCGRWRSTNSNSEQQQGVPGNYQSPYQRQQASKQAEASGQSHPLAVAAVSSAFVDESTKWR